MSKEKVEIELTDREWMMLWEALNLVPSSKLATVEYETNGAVKLTWFNTPTEVFALMKKMDEFVMENF